MDSVSAGEVVKTIRPILEFINGGPTNWIVGGILLLIVIVALAYLRKKQADAATQETEERKNEAVAENPGVNQGAQDDWDEAQQKVDDARSEPGAKLPRPPRP